MLCYLLWDVKVVVNDINKNLTNMYTVIRDQPSVFVSELMKTGDFTMASECGNSILLCDGRFELGGNFSQFGHAYSFASCENFTIAFVGEGEQTAYFQDIYNSDFANVDSNCNNFKRTNNILLDSGKVMYHLCLGILEGLQEMVAGLQEMLTPPELSEQAKVILAALGISIGAATVLAPEVVIPILRTIFSTAAAFFSVFMVFCSVKNIYNTAMGEGDRYEKARAFGKDGINLIVNVFALRKEVPTAIKDGKKVKNILTELLYNGYTSLKNPVRLSIISITCLDDFLQFIKGKVDADAEKYLKSVFNTYDDKMVKDTAAVIERAYSYTGSPLDQKSAKKIVDLLLNNESGSLDDVVETFKDWAVNGGRIILQFLERIKGKVDGEAFAYLENAFGTYSDELCEEITTVIETVYTTTQKPLEQKGVLKILDKLENRGRKTLADIASETVKEIQETNKTIEQFLERIREKVDVEAYAYLEKILKHHDGKCYEDVATVVEGVYARTKKALTKKLAKEVVEEVSNNTENSLDDIVEKIVKLVEDGTDFIKLSQSNIQHIKKHTFDGMAEQAKYLSDEQLANKLAKTTFFNKNWSLDEVVKYTEEAYNALRNQGKTGLQSIEINEEIINVFIKEDGTFDTAYGVYKYTVDDFSGVSIN